MIKYELNNNKHLYLILTVIILVLCCLLYYSFALFEFRTEKYNALNVKVGELKYLVSGDGLVDNTIISSKNTVNYLSLNLISNNNIDTKYSLSYYCNNCENLKIYKSMTSTNDVNDIITKNGTNYINLVIENNSNNDYSISFNIDAGYFYNNLDNISNITETYPNHNISLNVTDPNIEQNVVINGIIDENNTSRLFYDSKLGYSVDTFECNTTNEYYFDETNRMIVINDVNEDITCNISFIQKTFNICDNVFPTKENNVTYNLLNNNSINKKCEMIDFDRIESGLYINNSNIIFRGNTNNNYLKIDNMLWRILRINADGSIKLILEDVLDKSIFSNAILDNELVINNYLKRWYNTNLLKHDDIIVNIPYCFDTSKVDSEYNSLLRIKNNTPSLNCSNENIKYEKIGLVTTDEIMFAGSKNNSFLYTSKDNLWWTGSLQATIDNVDYAYLYSEKDGNFVGTTINSEYSVKPTISILGSVNVIGSGTREDPYIIK